MSASSTVSLPLSRVLHICEWRSQWWRINPTHFLQTQPHTNTFVCLYREECKWALRTGSVRLLLTVCFVSRVLELLSAAYIFKWSRRANSNRIAHKRRYEPLCVRPEQIGTSIQFRFDSIDAIKHTLLYGNARRDVSPFSLGRVCVQTHSGTAGCTYNFTIRLHLKM